MNGAQLHLLLNHFPFFGACGGVGLLLIALITKNRNLEILALSFFVLTGVFSGAAYLSGEGAEEVIKNYPVATEYLIETHAKSAWWTAWGLAALAVFSGIILFLTCRNNVISKLPSQILLVLSLAALALVMHTSHLGGLITHEEIRTEEFLQP